MINPLPNHLIHPYLDLARKGLWSQNPALVSLLGLCPLLAVSNTLINGLTLGIATTLTMSISGGLVSALRHIILRSVRLPLFVLIIASTVTLVDIAMNAWLHELHTKLGIFIPLIVTNCAILGRAEAFASRQRIDMAITDGLFSGLGFTLVIALLGATREIVATGQLLSGADLLFGPMAANWQIEFAVHYNGFLLATMPAGAFFGLGLLVAVKNWINDQSSTKNIPQTRRIPLIKRP